MSPLALKVAVRGAAVGIALLSVACSKANLDFAKTAAITASPAPSETGGTAAAALLNISDGATYDFGSKKTGTTIDKILVVTNLGASSAGSILAGGLSAPFAFKGGSYPGTGGTCGATLAGQTDCTIVVQFSPASPGSFENSLSIDYQDGENPLKTSRGLKGTGVDPAVLAISDGANYDFGTTAVGSTAEKTFTVTRAGGANATQTTALALAAPFSFKGGAYPGTGGTCGATISSPCTLVATYSPTGAGAAAESIRLTYHDGVQAQTATRGVLGTGAAPATLTISDGPTHAFGTKATGSSSDKTFTVSYSGGIAATGVAGSGLAAPFSFKGGTYPGTGGTCGTTIASSCTIVVTYAPTVSGAGSDTILLDYGNGAGAQQTTRDLTGTGAAPAALTISDGPTYGYGTKTTGTATDKTLTVSYAGGVPATGLAGSGLAAPFSFKDSAYPGTGGTCGAAISANCTIVVTFTPTSAAAFSDTVVLDYNDGAANQQATRDLTGTGTGSALALLSISDGPTHAFGTRARGSSSDKTLTVTNVGPASATGMTGSGLAAPYAFKGGAYPGTGGDCGATLGIAGNCTVVLTYAPTANGASSDTVLIDYNDGAGPQQATRDLSGTADDPVVLTISDGPNHDFGTRAVGSTNEKTFTVSRSATTVAAASAAGSGLAPPYSFKGGTYPGTGGNCGATISAGCTIVVVYGPAATGATSDTIVIDYNDGVSAQQATRDVGGTGANPAVLTISDGPTYPFGTLAVGSTTDKTLTVTYSGGVPATGLAGSGLAAPYSFKDGSYPGTGGTCGSPISANCTIVVTYAPGSAGASSDTVVLDYDNGVGPQQSTRDLSGTGAAPALLAISDGPTYDFITRPVGSSTDRTLTIAYTGGVSATGVSGSGLAAPFTFKGGSYPGTGGNCGATISADCTIVVTYAPTVSGTLGDTVLIDYNNGVSAQQATRALSGSGSVPSKLVVTGTTPIAIGGCHGFTVTAQDSGSNATWVDSNLVATLGGNAAGTFYSDSGCTSALGTATIAAGTSAKIFYLRDYVVQGLTLTADSGALTQGTLAIATQSTVSAIGTGKLHTCSVVDGGVQCSGSNTYGQLGDGANIESATPIQVTGLPAFSGATGAASGLYHSCAIVSGGVQCWGRNNYGQLGNSSTTDSNTPVNVTGLGSGSGVTAIAAGDYHTCAIVADAVKCWGYNNYGQLGDNSTTQRTAPVQASGLTSGATSVSAGSNHSCAVASGAAKCWGYNSSGQLGDNSTNTSNVPVSVSTLSSGVATVTAGDSHSCAIASGAVKCWGYNGYGQLGDSTTTQRTTAVQVTGLTAGATALEAGTNHTCAVVAGAAKCWGYNGYGQLGDGSSTQRTAPVSVTGLTADVTTVSAYENHTCAIKTGTVTGQSFCFGRANEGALGNRSTIDRLTATQAVHAAPPVQLSLHGRPSVRKDGCHAFAVALKDGTGSLAFSVAGATVTLGGGGAGTFYSDELCTAPLPSNQLTIAATKGYKTFYFKDGTAESPTLTADAASLTQGTLAVAVPASVPNRVASGSNHSCMTLNGGVRCWGRNDYGQLGDGTTLNSAVPVQTTAIPSGAGATEVAAGLYHSCAVIGGAVKCWGRNNYGQLGDGSTTSSGAPVQVTGLVSGVEALVAGEYFTCALVNSGVKCWGYNGYGQLGDGSTTQRTSPVTSVGLATEVASITAGSTHTCVSLHGGARCFGATGSSRLGNLLPIGNRSIQVDLLGPGMGVQLLGAGDAHTCVVAGGGIKCWGYNAYGQLGDSSTTLRDNPVQVTGLTADVTALETGQNHTCAVVAGAVRCWGYNGYGQLGDNTITQRTASVQVSGQTAGGTQLSLGDTHSCAMVSGTLRCWGYNAYGALGNHVTVDQYTPVNVLISGAPAKLAIFGPSKIPTSLCGPSFSVVLRDSSDNLAYATADTTITLGGGGAGTFYSDSTCTTPLAGSQLTIAATKGYAPFYFKDATAQGLTLTADATGLTQGTLATTAATSLGERIAITETHSCATVNGGVRCWGYNNYGQLGDGTTTDSPAAVQVKTLPSGSGATVVAAGRSHSCVVANGGVKCWGRNNYGQLGDGSTTSSSEPVQVTGLTAGVQDVVIGENHTCALVNSGIKCWGYNGYGQLGDGSSTQRTSPVDATGLTSGVSVVAAGGHQTCALTHGGVRCWGSNSYYQVGISLGSSVNTPAWTDLLSPGVGAELVALGYYHTCASIAGVAWCWGYNNYGGIGDGTTVTRASPVAVSGPLSGVTALDLGYYHSCAVASGAVKCWGYNGYGQLGDSSTTQRTTPVQTTGLTAGGASLAVGDQTSCAVVSGAIQCWGRNNYGQAGNGTTLDSNVPVQLTLAADPSKLAVFGPSAVPASKCSTALTVVLRDPSNNPAFATTDTTVTFGGAGSGTLYSDELCTSALPANQLTVAATTSLKTFYFKDAAVENLTITADASGWTQGSRAVSVQATVEEPLAAGRDHFCAVFSGGVRCWGYNNYGQLGNGSTTPSAIPMQVSGLPTGAGATAVAGGLSHSCALVNGGVKCWGRNNYGQLGNGSTTDSAVPVDVTGLASGVQLLVAGNNHSCALVDSGVKCWGYNGYGQLGDNSTTQRTSPVSVTGMASETTMITAGTNHTCAVWRAGIRCWGYNGNNELGYSTTTSSVSTPIFVDRFTPGSGAQAVFAGENHSCAVLNGGAWCWGYNNNGQLGDSSTTTRPAAVQVTGLSTGVTSMELGDSHSCAVVGGAINCWGRNTSGQVGDSTTTQRTSPVQTTGLTAGATRVAAASTSSCAVVSGAIQCWGDGHYGNLGNHLTKNSNAPTSIVTATSATKLALHGPSRLKTSACGTAFAVSLRDAADATAFAAADTTVTLGGAGSGTFYSDELCTSALGASQVVIPATKRHAVFYFMDASVESPTLTADGVGLTQGTLGIAVQASTPDMIAAGQYHSCAAAGGKAQCWGYNAYGQLGDNSTTQRTSPVQVSGLTTGVTQVATGQYHSCAIVSGAAKCWGRNNYGQLGDGTTTGSSVPVQVSGLGSGVQAIVAGDSHTCALLNSGVKCWGYNGYGQLGDGSTTQRTSPVDGSGLTAGVSSISASGSGTCATAAGGAVCWGYNSYNRLGSSYFSSSTTTYVPVDLFSVGAGVASVALGGSHACATVNGGAWCWGYNYYGQVGDATTTDRSSPVQVSTLGSGVTEIRAGDNHSCAIVSNAAKCWGINSGGALGDGTTTARSSPIDALGSSPNVISLGIGTNFSCAMMADGTARAWGTNANGQLGDASTTNRTSAVNVGAWQ